MLLMMYHEVTGCLFIATKFQHCFLSHANTTPSLNPQKTSKKKRSNFSANQREAGGCRCSIQAGEITFSVICYFSAGFFSST
jgi:hypothetical protein